MVLKSFVTQPFEKFIFLAGELRDNTWERVLSKQAVDAVFSGETGTASSFQYRKTVKNGQLGVYINDSWLGIDEFRLRINRVLGWNQVKSNDFSIRVIGDKIVFQGRGFGHLVGLGQRDAVFLAQKGYDYIQILKLFYPGCEVKRRPDGNLINLIVTFKRLL